MFLDFTLDNGNGWGHCFGCDTPFQPDDPNWRAWAKPGDRVPCHCPNRDCPDRRCANPTVVE